MTEVLARLGASQRAARADLVALLIEKSLDHSAAQAGVGLGRLQLWFQQDALQEMFQKLRRYESASSLPPEPRERRRRQREGQRQCAAERDGRAECDPVFVVSAAPRGDRVRFPLCL